MATRFYKLENPYRVQIPAYTDHWMMGDRYGLAISYRKVGTGIQLRVKLDKSGKIFAFNSDDCTEV